MAGLLRLIVAGACLLLVAMGAFAGDFPGDTGVLGPPDYQPLYKDGPWGPGEASAVCQAIAGSRTPAHTGTVDPFTGTPLSVYCAETDSNGLSAGGEYLDFYSSSPHCKDPHAQLDSSDNQCHCVDPYIPGGGICYHKPCPALGTGATGVADGTYFNGSDACVAGCGVHATQTITVTAGSNLGTYGVGGFVNTGQTCASNSTPIPKTAGDCYKQGMDSGTVNGVVVCTPPSGPITKSAESTSTTSTTPPAGGASGSTGGTTAAGDGTTSTKVTDNGNGTTTTTTVTQHPDGSTTTTTATGTSTDPTPDFCAKHPSLAVCILSSFSATCNAAQTTSCTGDAIQCAVAREQAVRNCTFFQPETLTGSPLAGDAQRFGTARTDGDVPSWSPAASANQAGATLDFSSGIDTTSTFGSSCIQDQSVSVAGGRAALVIPWSQFCSPLQIAGLALFAVTFVACAFIVFGK